MSKPAPMPLPLALEVVEKLRTWLGLGPEVEAVGSIRRQSREVGDIDFIAPMPTTPRDPLWEALARRFGREGAEIVVDPGENPSSASLFVTPRAAVTFKVERPLGDVVKGLRHGFRQATLTLRGKTRDVKLEVYRYDPGPTGNMGWCRLMRTGCGDFGQAMLCKHIAMRGVPNSDERPGSKDGYLLGGDGTKLPTADEEAVFHLCGMKVIAPYDRTEGTAKNIWDGIRRLQQ